MNKKDLVNKVVDVLRDNDVRKPVAAQRTVFHISDDSGNQKDFVVKKSETGLLFTTRDVGAIIDTCLAVIEDSIKHGEEISIPGYGVLGVQYRAARRSLHPETGEPVVIEARYVPKFQFGTVLRTAARLYELSMEDREAGD